MKNLFGAVISTFIVWLVTLLTTSASLPFFSLFLVFTVSYLFVQGVRYDTGDK
jgi:hypothetical protein